VTRPRAAALAALSAATIACVLPLVCHASLPDGSDVSFHALAARSFAEALREGIAYPRWVGDANLGFGAPTFVIYPPLAFYLTALAGLATGGDALEAIRWVLVAGTAATAASFWLSTRDVATDAGAAAGAALYLLLPYHVLDLYERFALAEYLAFAWLPPLFWAVRRLGRGFSWRAWFALALCYAGLTMTHALSAYMVLLVLGPYAALVAWRARRWALLAEALAAGAVALACCGVYLVPMAVERHTTNHAFQLVRQFDWRRNFVLRDETQFGFLADFIKPWVTAASLAAAAVGGAAFALAHRQADAGREGALGLWAFALQVPVSAPLWALVPGLAVVQFPWRFVGFATLFAATGMAVALSGPRREAAAMALAVLAPPVVGLSVVITSLHPFSFDAEAARDSRHRYVYEHMPAGTDLSFPWAQMTDEQPDAMLAGPGRVETLAWTAEARRLRVTSPEGGRVVVRTFAFPGWEARVDGLPVPVRPDAKFGAIEVDVPAGEHEVEARYAETWDRRAGAAVSALGLAALAALAVVARARNRER
jgi:hypothetical protein